MRERDKEREGVGKEREREKRRERPFIMDIPAEGFMLIPPLSNVTPFPIRQRDSVGLPTR